MAMEDIPHQVGHPALLEEKAAVEDFLHQALIEENVAVEDLLRDRRRNFTKCSFF